MFIFWSLVKPTYDDAYDEDNDDVSSDDEVFINEDIDDGVAKRFDKQDLNLDDFDCALKKMSITPKNSSFKFGGRYQEPARMPSRIRPSTSPESL